MIIPIYTQPGYLDVVNFLNAESASPTPGEHSAIVQEVFNTIQGNDHWGFIQELYSPIDLDEYMGALFVTFNGRAVFIREAKAEALNLNDEETKTVIVVEHGKGLTEMYSDLFELKDALTNTLITGAFQIYKNNLLGGDIYNAYYKINNAIECRGEVKSLVVVDQELGAYNIKIDQDLTPIISFISARDFYTKFEVRLSPTEKRRFSYYKVGQLMYVEDNSYSRQSLAYLEKEKVIFAPDLD